ncbi:hypothetical protein niasHT_001874 [Heterodera trifolii]|uniref:CCHC-type domain-containing protein n=1 Tax=Heterodera trifolii TaxID=157864 RepID=A0ABD2LPI8_9BILA
MDPENDEQDHNNDGNEQIGGSPTAQIGAGQKGAKKGKDKQKGAEVSTIPSGSGTQPGGMRNLRSNGIAIRAIRDQLERASGPLADRIAEARELLDPDFNAGEKPQAAVCLSAMERGLRELVGIFKGHFDRGLAAIGDEAPELHDYLYDAFTRPLPAATRCLGLRSHPPPAELLQIAMEHLGDLRTVRRTLEDVEKLSQLSSGTRSGTEDIRPVGDKPAVPHTPPPLQLNDPTDHQSDDLLVRHFPWRFEQLHIQEERRAVTPVMRSVVKAAQYPEAHTREWVNQTTARRERTPSPHVRQAGNHPRPRDPDRSITGNPNPCSRFRVPEQVRGRDPSVLRTARRDEGTTAFETVRLQPPTFSGKPEDWTTFWSYFKRAVDVKPITGFEKQLLLLRCLKEGSPARRAVEVYPPSDGNYPVVIQLLRERFGDTDDLQRAIRAQLLHLPPARENVQSLTTVVDEFERGVCQLEQLGANVDDASFGPLLESKLPVRILTELRIRESTSGTKWSVREFRRAVGAQVRCMRAAETALAAMREPERRTESRPEPDRNARGTRNREQFPRAFMVGGNPLAQRPTTPPGAPAPRTGTHAPNRKVSDQDWNRSHRPPQSRGEVPTDNGCSLCQKPGHRPSNCPAYPTAQTRRQRLFEQKRCLRCLSSDHIANCCPRPRACRWCKRDDHHSLVCWGGSGTQLTAREPPAGVESRGQNKPKTEASVMLVQNDMNSESDSRSSEPRTKSKRKKPKRRRNDQANQSEKQGERSPGTDQRAFTAMGESQPAYLMVCPVVAANDDTTRQQRTVLLWDPGSQVDWAQTVLTEQLELPNAGSAPLVVQVFGGSKKRVPSTKHRLKLKRLDGGWEELEVSSVPNVCTPIQTKLVGPGTRPGLLEPKDATVQPQIVIGIRKFWDFVIGFKKSAEGAFLIDTVFGTVLCGEHFGAPLGQSVPRDTILMAITGADSGWNRMPAASAVEQFWSLETIGIRDDPTGDADTEAIIQFEKSVRQDEDGRYSIRLPWRDPIPAFPSNFAVAYRRLTNLINRLQRMPEVLEQYRAVIEEQFKTGIIEEAAIGVSQREHFIPHQAVITPKKLRVVYDASAHAKGAPSLNDCLLRGPVWLPDLAGMLLRFRACQVPVIADVEKAFLMVGIEEADREVCKFLWVRDPTKPVTTDAAAFSAARFRAYPEPVLPCCGGSPPSPEIRLELGGAADPRHLRRQRAHPSGHPRRGSRESPPGQANVHRSPDEFEGVPQQ